MGIEPISRIKTLERISRGQKLALRRLGSGTFYPAFAIKLITLSNACHPRLNQLYKLIEKEMRTGVRNYFYHRGLSRVALIITLRLSMKAL